MPALDVFYFENPEVVVNLMKRGKSRPGGLEMRELLNCSIIGFGCR